MRAGSVYDVPDTHVKPDPGGFGGELVGLILGSLQVQVSGTKEEVKGTCGGVKREWSNLQPREFCVVK
jgi:hypothetical protein